MHDSIWSSTDVHLFADSSLPSFDQRATELMTGRILEFLSDRVS